MLSWIIIAIAVALIFGVVNTTQVRAKGLELINKHSPLIKEKLLELKNKYIKNK